MTSTARPQEQIAPPASRIQLPARPADQEAAPVAAWRQPVEIDTYDPEPPQRCPMFLETRVYQGSSGRVYPLAFHDRISTSKRPRTWQAIHLENRWIRLMVLPEIGGRIHIGLDRTNGYDFFYRNNVIKPALVGLAGPWIAGGVEFNWPQHHRPATFLPVEAEIERHGDGAVTVWCSDHDPFARMKGMHGVTLRPDTAVVELRVRLYNRTEEPQTFLWWANVAARVSDYYQSFFPEDVQYVADHAKRAMTTFPAATGHYYGVDYRERVSPERPGADRLDWYRNIPVPTSYMCVDSRGDFFGGYDHAAEAGFVHWADHRIAPGKKQWTWGNHEFGWAWDRNLTDTDGPYVELMAGVYTDNQPDFSFLAPGETKTFTQCWYPIQGIGPAQQATPEVAVSIRRQPGPEPTATVGVAVTAVRPVAEVTVASADGREIARWIRDLAPEVPLVETVALDRDRQPHELVLTVTSQQRTLLRWQPRPPADAQVPDAAKEPPAPESIGSIDQLYLTGLHLEQYRHATRSPEPYWQEALRRDPGDARCNVALAARRYRAGCYEEAEQHLRQAVNRLTMLNPNPYDGEAHYRLGLVLGRLGRPAEADHALAKATWNYAWRAPAHLALAQLDAVAGRNEAALHHLALALQDSTDNLRARDLQACLLRRAGRAEEAADVVAGTLKLDPLDWWARDLAGQPLTCDARTCVDVAMEYAAAGQLDDALRVLEVAAATAAKNPYGGTGPMVAYHRAALLERAGDADAARRARADAKAANPDWCFPSGLDDKAALDAALATDPADGRAAALLGMWHYDRRRYDDAIAAWERGVEQLPEPDPLVPVTWRNLGIAAFNVQKDPARARDSYERAVAAAPDDARLWYERDQLAKRTGIAPADRLAVLEGRPDLVDQRDDLSVELAVLYCQVGRPADARRLLLSRQFQPWEGGEGVTLAAWTRTCQLLARRALAAGDASGAVEALEDALSPPASLGEARHLLANPSDVWFGLGEAAAAAGRQEEAKAAWRRAATFSGDFQDMSVVPYSEMTYWSAQAWRRLGDQAQARDLLHGLRDHANRLRESEARIDYFATSLPTMLLFADDLQRRQETTALFLLAQAELGLGNTAEGSALLEEVLDRDPNHALAADLRSTLP